MEKGKKEMVMMKNMEGMMGKMQNMMGKSMKMCMKNMSNMNMKKDNDDHSSH